MNYLRIVLCILLGLLGVWFSSKGLTLAFTSHLPQKVEVPGMMNIWAGYFCIFVCCYLIVYSINDQFSLKLPIGEINRVLIAAAILSVLLSVGCKVRIEHQLQDYVDCPNLQKIKSHYTSNTYAVDVENCTN